MLHIHGRIARIAGPILMVFALLTLASAGNFGASMANLGGVGVGFLVNEVGELLLLHSKRLRGSQSPRGVEAIA